MNKTMPDPSSLALKDFHLPHSIDWWPLAIGWWLLIFAIILLAILAYYWCRKTRLKKEAMRLFKVIKKDWSIAKNQQQTIKDLSILLRRLNLAYYPNQNIAGLSGKQWLKHLDQGLKTNQFSQGIGKILLDAPYQANIDKIELKPLFDLIEKWIKNAKWSKI